MSGKIFISYRREDDPGNAGRLSDQLKQAFGSEQLFFDVDSIELGRNFLAVIDREMTQSAVLLVVVGTRWLHALKRRTTQSNTIDYVRREIELAIEQDRRIIPVLVDGAAMPREEQLPSGIQSLAYQQSFRINHDRFTSDVQLLIQSLRKILEKSERAPPQPGLDEPESDFADEDAHGEEQFDEQGSDIRQSPAPSDDRWASYAASGRSGSGELPAHHAKPVAIQADGGTRESAHASFSSGEFASHAEGNEVGEPTDVAFYIPSSEGVNGGARYARPRANEARPFPFRSAIVIGIVLIVVGAGIFWGKPAVSYITSLFESSSTVEAPKDASVPAIKPKIIDRIGQPSSSGDPVAPVAQRVVLIDGDPSDSKARQYVGSVVWRTEPIKAFGNQKPDIAVRADIDIPDRKFKMTMSFRRNTDTSLPASHTVELTFILPPDFANGGIGNVPEIQLKSSEQARGTPLAGLAVKVTDGFFLVGLSNVGTDLARNLQLLKERSWFDVPLVYTNQHRAIIAIEKGAPGERAFNDAFAAWGE